METIILGTGVLTWNRYERVTDRYGTVKLAESTAFQRFITFDEAPLEQHGTLVAVVLDTRRSAHIGDFARGSTPNTPTVGDRITLGTGTLIRNDTTEIGVRPDDGREAAWLDPDALYRAHEQTVRIEWNPDPAE